MKVKSKLACATLGAVLTALAVGVPLAGANQVFVTATPHVARGYTWTIRKSVDQPTLTLRPGQTATVNYTVTATSTPGADARSVVGNLAIPTDSPEVDAVNGVQMELANYNDGVLDTFCLSACVPTTPAGTAILPWSCAALPFILSGPSPLDCSFTYTGPALSTSNQLELRSRVQFCEAGVCLPFNCPLPMCEQDTSPPFDFGSVTPDLTDNCAALSDTYGGSFGTQCNNGTSPQTYTFTYSRTIGPFNATTQCGLLHVPNTATFTTNTSGSTGSAGADVAVTVDCTQPPQGCTLTIGYWKTHAGFGPQADVVTPLLPLLLGTAGGAKTINVTSAALAVQLLSFNGSNNVSSASNGINKLYAQLLGAKLSIKAGASGTAVAATIAAADAFLAAHDSLGWSGLSNAQKAIVLGWATTLDNYNNGLIGPFHCA